MKWYYPTSALNYDAIISSMCILPPSLFWDGSIGFSKHGSSVVDVAEDYILLYSRQIIWTPPVGNSMDYPMLVEIDIGREDLTLGQERILPNGVSCWMASRPFYFSSESVLGGKIKVLFRTKEEMRSIVQRTQIGVAECKTLGLTSAWARTNFGLIEDPVDFEAIKNDIAVESIADFERQRIRSDFIRRDRVDGASAGMRAGRWVRCVQEGKFCDTLRNELSFVSWRKVLSSGMNAVIDMICCDEAFRWSANTDDIIGFCGKCWKECFADSGDEEIHELLRNIARVVCDPQFDFPISKISNEEMQALACFVKAGKSDGKLINILKAERIALPELALALHGALVGYSVLSRSFFERRSFMDEQANMLVDVPNRQLGSHAKVATSGSGASLRGNNNQTNNVTNCDKVPKTAWGKRILDIFLNSVVGVLPKSWSQKKKNVVEAALVSAVNECSAEDEDELLLKLESEHGGDGWGKKSNAYKELCAKMGVPDPKSCPRPKSCPKPKPSPEPEPELPLGPLDGVDNVDACQPKNEISEPCGTLLDGRWIKLCAEFISGSKARDSFIRDMEWFVGNHREYYRDPRTGKEGKGRYFGQYELTLNSIEEHLRKNNESGIDWVKEYSAHVPIERIMLTLKEMYG